jgi:alpha-D-ribose 1-methylphosphonate 5-triphosphate synthase subunit PhnG
MNDIVIKAENLGKKYTIGHQAERGGYTALRDVLMQNARTLTPHTTTPHPLRIGEAHHPGRHDERSVGAQRCEF